MWRCSSLLRTRHVLHVLHVLHVTSLLLRSYCTTVSIQIGSVIKSAQSIKAEQIARARSETLVDILKSMTVEVPTAALCVTSPWPS